MILLVKSDGEAAVPEWRHWFGQFAPSLEVRWWDDPGVDPAQVRYVFVWQPDRGRIAGFPHLRLVLSDAAGVGHITADPTLPAHLPLVRMVNPETGQRMAEYACMMALALLRDLPRSIARQRARQWDEFPQPRTARQTRVGVMGLGQLGTAAAAALAALGFQVAGWATRPRDLPGIACFAGDAMLAEFLARTDILINLLPETPATRGILRAETLALLPPGAGLVQAGRGSHLVLRDLFAALDSGHLAGAAIDVFEREPLSSDHPAWSHPRIIVTAHGAAFDTREGRARTAAAAIAADLLGEPVPNLYDPARGY